MIFIIVSAIILADQLSKVFACHFLSLHQSVPLLKNVFHLTLVYNRGAAFGILKNQLPVFIIAAVLAVWFIFLSLKKNGMRKLSVYNLSLAFILAGAVGNLIDRVVFGHVIDFLDFRVWPVFNLADSSITVGAILLGWQILFSKKPTIR